MKRIIRDSMPSGVTSQSLLFLKHNEERFMLGKLLQVTIRYKDDLEWVTEAEYENAVLITDGFSTGYSGEGPSGLKRFLEEHGEIVEFDRDPRQIHLSRESCYSWQMGTVPAVHFSKDEM